MKFPETNIVCFNFSLRAGALFLGWLGIICSPIALADFSDQIFHLNIYFHFKKTLGLSVLIVNCAIIFITSSCLLHGVYQKIEKYVKIYLYGMVLTLILSINGNVLILFDSSPFLIDYYERNTTNFRILMFLCFQIGKKTFDFDGKFHFYFNFSFLWIQFLLYEKFSFQTQTRRRHFKDLVL